MKKTFYFIHLAAELKISFIFQFIVVMAYKVVTGQASEVEDIREDEGETPDEKSTKTYVCAFFDRSLVSCFKISQSTNGFVKLLCTAGSLGQLRIRVEQGFPTFFAARIPLSGQSILSTPKKFLRYILLYKRYISCSVTQGSSYPLGVRVPPVGNPWCRLSRMRNRQLIVTLSRITPTRHGRIPTPQYHAATCANIVARELRQQISRSRGQSSPVVAETHFQPPKVFTSC